MTVKTIKGIDKRTWNDFKSIAARNKMKLSTCFARMITDYKHKADTAWENILSAKKILSDKEAEEMLQFIEKTRREKGYRDTSF